MKQYYLHLAFTTSGAVARTGYGLVGYGIEIDQPPCAFACRDAISGATLNCSTIESADMDMDGMSGMSEMSGTVITDAQCYATDDAFLQTLAWCVSSKCSQLPAWRLEKFWNDNVAGTADVQPDPKETYQQALDKIHGTLTVVYAATGSLNETSLVADALWYAAYNNDVVFAEQEGMQEKYGLVIFLSGVIIPIAFSVLRLVPFPGAWCSKFNAWIIDPPLFGTKHNTAVFFGLAKMPTRGQALFILYFIVINTVLSAVNYEFANPNTLYPDDEYSWMVMLISNRLGLLSFANLPLLFLYAGRNNLLLWVTDWSHPTFLILHQWIAAIATLQAVLHSIIYLDKYVKKGTHASESQLPYWYCGVIGTVGLVVLFPTSVIPIRRKFYEIFLAWHVLISILVVAGCYWHILFEFDHKWGYEVWIIICMAIWAFDHVFRVLRVARYGLRTAIVTVIDDDYIRITIPRVSTSGHAYLYFPTLTWRIWENHPFSIASATLPPSAHLLAQTSAEPKSSGISEKQGAAASPTAIDSADTSSHASNSSRSLTSSPQAGITFYVRTQNGLTSLLRHRASVRVLIEAGYSSESILSESPRKSPMLITIAGGVGITAVLPHLRTHPGNIRLYWGCRTQALVDDVKSTGVLSGIENEIVVGNRIDIRGILENELVDGATDDVYVMVSGPDGMIDEVRTVFVEIAKKRARFRGKLVIESFSW